MGLVKKLSIALVSASVMVSAAAAQAKAVTLTYDKSISSPGLAPGQLFVPQGIGVQDSTNQLFVSNGRGLNPDGSFNPNVGNRVDVFDQQGNYLRAIGSGRQGKGEGFDEPADLKFDPVTGNVHVGDVFNSEIDVYNPNTGEYIRSYGSFGGPVQGRLFFGPGGMSFDNKGNIWITDFSADVIKAYNANTGELVKTVGSNGTDLGKYVGPAGITVSPNTGRIYVGDQYNGRIQVLDEDGNALFAFASRGSEPGQLREPIGVEVDEYENIYVADSQNSRVQVFDKDGKFLTAFGEPARNAAGEIVPPPSQSGPPFGDPLVLQPGVFNWTAGLHYDRGKLYVGDFFQGRVQVLNVDNKPGTKVPEPTSVLGLGLLGFGVVVSKLRKNRHRNSTVSVEG
ncbi:scytonemin biosynthesis PEP-CTERM protein ScyF [Scytonema sp. UIC 10036]|uniref:scytonemin biosynthesis PEP-CTERM protein ScyF n=1 Tax=Scytonema sp. UIC 10036 TaxID=2304196 RepID=UPI0012DA49D9|nr:scytonemin biosynthesis PEP-CTERM protein ScyF [Scytonema sp. UIC 10036]MUG98798.1 scytonemin biosynthesis PEP-CTERM protein ScyF [Scytonema sp. UIC 10036]